MLLPLILKYRVTGGLFWCRRRDFEAIGGFNEDFVSLEDLDFALRLKGAWEDDRPPFFDSSRRPYRHLVTQV